MLNMQVDVSDFARGANDVQRKQLPIATAWSLNDTARDVHEHMQNRMRVVFDRPTRFAVNAFMVWRATKQTLVAEVKERPSVGARHFLKVQERGGTRGRTGLEGLLSGLVDGPQIKAVVPAAGAKINSFGNWSPSERGKVIDALRTQRGKRPGGDRSASGRKRMGYFVPERGSTLSPGVWKRQGRKKLIKVLNFTTVLPRYDERLGFYDGASDVFGAKFPVRFSEAFRKAMATAR